VDDFVRGNKTPLAPGVLQQQAMIAIYGEFGIRLENAA
jgi:hypothetical protein